MTPLARMGKEYVSLTLIKHQYHDVWDVYWMADSCFWKREDLYIDRYHREYPYKPLEKQPFMSLEDILISAKKLLDELNRSRDQFEGNDLIRCEYLIEHTRALIIRTRFLLGESLSYDEYVREMFSLTPPEFNEKRLKAACDEAYRNLPGEGTLAEKITRFKKCIEIPKDRFPEVMNYAASFFHNMAVEHMGIKDACMPRMRYRDYDPNIDFVTILFGYDYDEVYLEQNFNQSIPYYLDNFREVAGHELEPGHFTFMNLRTKGAIDTGYPELGLNLHCPSSAFIEAGARISVELSLDTAEKEREFDEKLFDLAGVSKEYIQYLDVFRKYVRASNYGKIKIEQMVWDGLWTEEEARSFAEKYAINYDEILRFRKDGGHYTSHCYSTDMLREYYDSHWNTTEEKWAAYARLCQYPFSMKQIEDGTFDPFAFKL